MPCYRCGTRQADPEPGKPSPWRRGVVREHQVLVCPSCHPIVLPDLSRCARCGSAHLVRRLDQVECLDCRLTREAAADPPDVAETVPSPNAETVPSPNAGTVPLSNAGTVPLPNPVSRMSGISGSKSEPDIPDISVISLFPSSADDPSLAAEVARALERLLGTR